MSKSAKPKKQKQLPIPRIQLRYYEGKHGNFANHTQPMIICEPIGRDGDYMNDNMSGPWGHPAATKYAHREAEGWHQKTRWPVVEIHDNGTDEDLPRFA